MNQKYILIFAVIILLGIGGYYVATKKAEAPVIDNQQNVSPDETADWKTYTNIKYGFEFKYPNDWILTDTSNGLDIHLTNYKTEYYPDCSKFIGMEIQPANELQGPFDIFVKSIVNRGEIGPGGELTKTIIGEKSAFKVAGAGWEGGCGGPGYYIKTSDTQYMFIFSGRGKETDQIFIDQILSTFKFTQSNSADKIKSITILSPDGGENLKTGETYNIKWSSKDLSSATKILIAYKPINARLDIDVVAQELGSIEIANTTNTSSFIWEVPKVIMGYIGSSNGSLRCPSGTIATRQFYLEIMALKSDGTASVYDRSSAPFNLTGPCVFEGE